MGRPRESDLGDGPLSCQEPTASFGSGAFLALSCTEDPTGKWTEAAGPPPSKARQRAPLLVCTWTSQSAVSGPWATPQEAHPQGSHGPATSGALPSGVLWDAELSKGQIPRRWEGAQSC